MMKKNLWQPVLFTAAFAISVMGAITAAAYLNRSLAKAVMSAAVENQSVVILDAGHGGIDGGASAKNVREADINLSVTLKTEEFLQLMGYRVIMTRDGDYSIHDPSAKTIREQKRSDLKNRLALMQSIPQAVCVSIHQNHYPQSYVHGAQVFYGAAEGSEPLAQLLQSNVAAYLQTDNERKIKQADSALYILANNTVNPSVMVECGFLSNPQDAADLQNDEYCRRLAFVIASSLMQYENADGSDMA